VNFLIYKARFLVYNDLVHHCHIMPHDAIDVYYDDTKFTWSEKDFGYFESGGSLGAHGAIHTEKGWAPAFINFDSSYPGAEAADEFYDTPVLAIARSFSFFS
jgi:hypothetical protein